MLKVVDLFSGAGGLTFGFLNKIENNRFVKRNDFSFLFANEYNKDAAESFKKNFPEIKMFVQDISLINGKFLDNEGIDINNVDVIIGGPPCQSYSTIGKRINDDRAKMYIQFSRMLELVKPKLFIFENVVGILSMKDESRVNIIDKIITDFDVHNYNTVYETIDATDYGIPQSRKRVFIVGVRKDIQTQYIFPGRSMEEHHQVTLRDAISDLTISKNKKLTDYQFLMNSKRGKNDRLHVHGKYGERIRSIIMALNEGETKIHINQKVINGVLPEQLYLSSGYNNTYGRLWWDKPGVTITNKFNTPSSLRCIHPVENRALTTREAARLQSFPDDFIFCGSITSINSQIGNAVPPILSIFMADSIIDFFNRYTKGE